MDMGISNQHWPDIAGLARESDAPLRPVGWSDLCARLAAGQDLRGALAGLPVSSAMKAAERHVASFHRSAAEMLAEGLDGGDVVNLNPSVNCKATRDIRDPAEANPSTVSPDTSAAASASPRFFE